MDEYEQRLILFTKSTLVHDFEGSQWEEKSQYIVIIWYNYAYAFYLEYIGFLLICQQLKSCQSSGPVTSNNWVRKQIWLKLILLIG